MTTNHLDTVVNQYERHYGVDIWAGISEQTAKIIHKVVLPSTVDLDNGKALEDCLINYGVLP